MMKVDDDDVACCRQQPGKLGKLPDFPCDGERPLQHQYITDRSHGNTAATLHFAAHIHVLLQHAPRLISTAILPR